MATMVLQTLRFHVEADEEKDLCWICLESSGELLAPCKCPNRFVHQSCLARWQLHSAGREEERACRFCNQMLPDWRPALTPQDLQPASSVMSVKYRGTTHYITYTPGPDSTRDFMQELARLGIQMTSPKHITFLCRAPDTGGELSLKGMEAFDAAAYCASISAAKRRKSQCESDSGCSSADPWKQGQEPDAAVPHDNRTCSSGNSSHMASLEPAGMRAVDGASGTAPSLASRGTSSNSSSNSSSSSQGKQSSKLLASTKRFWRTIWKKI